MSDQPDVRTLLRSLRPSRVPDPDALWKRIREGESRALRRPGHVVRPWLMAAAVVLAALGGGVVGTVNHYRAPAVWSVTGGADLAPGDWVETRDAPADVLVGRIGSVTLAPATRMRRDVGGLFGHRLTLERGALSAVINAPPRLFFVRTPSVLATDLGCAYTLEVDSAGVSRLHVTVGWVELREHGATALVPAGHVAVVQPGRAPGTPYPVNFAQAAREALERLDAGMAGDTDLDLVLAMIATPSDPLTYRKERSITLWHLAQRLEGAQRTQVVHRLAELSPPPEGVTREGILALDRRMLDRWRRDLNPMWSEEAMSWPVRVGRALWTWAMR